MVRTIVALLLLAMPLTAAADTISRYGDKGGGGSAWSPDRKWRVWAPRLPADTDREHVPVWLSGGGVKKRLLMQYERELLVIWPTDRRYVVLDAYDPHDAKIRIFNLAARDRQPPDAIARRIDAAMRRVAPLLGTIEDRQHEFGRVAGALCVSVSEAGLPPGRTDGSYVSRSAAFRLDVSNGRATRIARCPANRAIN